MIVSIKVHSGASQTAVSRKEPLTFNFFILFPFNLRLQFISKGYQLKNTNLCDVCSEQAKTLDTWFSSLILSTQNWPAGKETPSISRPPSGKSTASFASPRIVKLSDRVQVGKPGTISTADEAFGNNGVASVPSFRWAHACLRN